MNTLAMRACILLAYAIFSLPAYALAAPASGLLPLDSWVYPALDKLVGLGLIDSSLQGALPFTRLEAARQLREALQNEERTPGPAVVAGLLRQLENELHDQLTELPGSYLQPLRHLAISYLYQDGEDSIIGGSGVSARQFSLNTNNFGIDYSVHSSAQLVFASEARFARALLLEVRPIVLVGEGDGSDLRLLEGRAALEMGPIELSIGRQSLWWGQGRHGSLLLSNNAKPLDMLRLTTPSPVLLPWIFKYLGPFRFDLFLSKLEKEQVIPEPYLSGLRLNLKPLPWFELGASRTIIFGGQGRPHIDFSDFATILSGRNLSGGGDTSNSLAALDASIKLPFLLGTEIYGEFGGEDEAGHFIANASTLYGLYLPKIDPTGRGSLRFEYADLSRIDNNSPVWYRHGTYRSGYTYEGKILGHHVGGAAKDLFTELRVLLPRDLTLTLSLDLEKRGYDQAVKEEHLQPGIGLEWPWLSALAFTARYRADKVKNFGFTIGDDRTFQLAEIGFKGRW